MQGLDERKYFEIANRIIQKYLDRIRAWLRDFHIFERNDHSKMGCCQRFICLQGLPRTGKDVCMVDVIDPDTEYVVQRCVVPQLNDHSTPKQVWIGIDPPAAETVDKLW